MPVDLIPNPAASFGETYLGGGVVTEAYLNSDTVPLPNGTLVSLSPLTAPSLGPVTIKRSTITPDAYMLGVVVNAPTGGVLPGQVATIVTEGYALALFAATTTAGHYALQGTGTAGTCADSATATNAQTLGVVLSSVTIAAGTALVPIYVHRM